MGQHQDTHRLSCLQALSLEDHPKRAIANNSLCLVVNDLLVRATAGCRADNMAASLGVALYYSTFKDLKRTGNRPCSALPHVSASFRSKLLPTVIYQRE